MANSPRQSGAGPTTPGESEGPVGVRKKRSTVGNSDGTRSGSPLAGDGSGDIGVAKENLRAVRPAGAWRALMWQVHGSCERIGVWGTWC